MMPDELSLSIGQKILYQGELPRVVEMIQAQGVEGEEGYIAAHEGKVSSVSLKQPVEVTIVALQAGPGKEVGIQLNAAPEGYRWYDAHECDGACKMGLGWWITTEHISAREN